MGMLTKYQGEISINPPLNWMEIQRTEIEVKDSQVRLDILTQEVHTEEGTLVRKTCAAIEPWKEEAYKGYDVQGVLQSIIDMHPEHTFSGYFECFYEEPGVMWRLVVTGRTVQKIEPVITWPEPEDS